MHRYCSRACSVAHGAHRHPGVKRGGRPRRPRLIVRLHVCRCCMVGREAKWLRRICSMCRGKPAAVRRCVECGATWTPTKGDKRRVYCSRRCCALGSKAKGAVRFGALLTDKALRAGVDTEAVAGLMGAWRALRQARRTVYIANGGTAI